MADPGLCCGSAGTYSILQPALSSPMLRAKVDNPRGRASRPVATANVGCYAYLRQEARVPVAHWAELWYDRRGSARFLTKARRETAEAPGAGVVVRNAG
jgi:Fe-S oxidoreductase